MDSLLIAFSLCLHGITFVVIFILFQRVQKATESERNFEKRVKEIEDIFASYLLEIKDENKKFLQMLSKADHVTPTSTETRMAKMDQEKIPVDESKHINIMNQQESTQHDSDYRPKVNHVKDHFETPSIQTQIMHLHENGYSIEDIAKKLNKGNTEVELIIKFNQKMHQ